jgi:voltage-gated potassium channel Kch
VIYRLIDGFNYRLCIIFVDRYHPQWGLRSLNRSLLLLLLNYAEIIIGFSVLFLATGSIGKLDPEMATEITLSSRLDAIYFSVVTITTLGYGDFHPISPLGRLLALAETAMGILLLVLVLGTFLQGVSDIRAVPRKED